jgi:hypothetical protein
MNHHTFLLILHVLGAGIVIGVAALAFAAVVKPPFTQISLDRMAFVGRFGMWGSIWQFLSGAALMGLEWEELGRSPLIWTKIVLWAVEGFLASTIVSRQVKRISGALAQNQQPPSAGLSTTLLANLLLIITIAALGVVVVSGGEG